MERMKQITERQREILDGVDDGKLTADQKTEFDELQVEYDALDETRRPGRRTEPNSFDMNSPMYSGGDSKSSQSVHTTAARASTTGRTYQEMFGSPKLGSSAFSSFNDYVSAVQSGRHHDGLQPAMLASNEGSGSQGGFLVPEEFSAELLDSALESEIVRPRADVRPMTTDVKKIAGLHHSDASGGSLYGAFTAKWKAEAETGDVETAAVRKIELNARKLFIYTKSSNELLRDGENFERQLSGAMIGSASWHMDDAFLNGTGGNQPSGVLSDPAIIEISKETGQASTTILYANLTKMFARIHPASVSNAVWVCSSTCIPQLLELTVSIGTGGALIPAMSESNGVFRILTLPVIFTEKMQTLGTSGDILLADFSQYVIGMRREVTMDSSMHAGFATDETAFRTIVRCDGQGKWSAAYTPANGDTTSWCVKLATRA